MSNTKNTALNPEGLPGAKSEDKDQLKGLLDILVPSSACVRGGTLTIPAFEHLMGGIMCGLAAFLTHTVSPKFVYMSFFVSFMLVQCAVTGFSPPRLMGTYVLGLKRD